MSGRIGRTSAENRKRTEKKRGRVHRKDREKTAETAGKKEVWRPGNLVYPLPAVLVSMATEDGRDNLITVAWTGTVCTNPAMLYISVRPERYSYELLKESKEFVVNLTTEDLAYATDWCGVRSGRDYDKWKETGLTRGRASALAFAPTVKESPVNIECRITQIQELGSHHMFLAKVLAVQADTAYLEENGRFSLNQSGLLAYSHGEYLSLGKSLGKFGWSVKTEKKHAGKKKK